MIKNLQEKLKFIELVDKMKEIKRAIILKNNEQESDAEHSFHLAIMVLTFGEDFPDINLDKALKLALIHDLVEIYAGDTVAVVDIEGAKTKEKREKEAFDRLEKEFGTVLYNVIDLIKEYESKKSIEARFVSSLDKVHPIIQSVLTSGICWEQWKIDFNKIKERQYSKIYPEFGFDKILDIYFEKAEKENMGYYEK